MKLPISAFCLAVFAAASQPLGAQSAADAGHGTLVQVQRVTSPPAGGTAYRLVYRSTAVDGSVIPVSAIAVVPNSPPPPGGRTVVAWAHPTTGVQTRCAPSLSPLRFQMTAGLADFIRRGMIVVATDYPGLGIGSTHPFLDGQSEGRSVLDSVLAARSLPGAMASSTFALWGHSQGGQAVLFAADMAKQYTPQITLAGVAAAAPATDLGALLRDDLGTTGGNNLAALTLWAWNRYYGASYTGVVTPAALPAIDAVANDCIDALLKSPSKRRAQKTLAASYFTVPDVTALEPWRSLIARNSAPVLPPSIPIFLAQGDADVIVHPAVTYSYATKLCADGSRVRLDVLPKIGHGWAAVKSAHDAASWIADLVAGVPAPSDCGRF